MSEGPAEKSETETSPSATSPCTIVGIGASAGGLEALEELFDNLASDTGMAFIVIQHLSPDFKSQMDQLLSRRTDMPVQLVDNGMQTEPDHVYLIPPNKEMVISGRKLLLTDRNSGGGVTHPIDQFFRSMASDVGPSCVGVILSGTGSDGSRGIRDIHAAGGLVLCQDKDSASFDGMPVSAIATGVVDQVLPPEQIAEELAKHAQREHLCDDPSQEDTNVSSELIGIFDLLRDQYGIDFGCYKLSTVERRVKRRIELVHAKSLSDYSLLLKQEPAELAHLLKDLLIGVTQFFRDRAAFDSIRPEIAQLIQKKAKESQPLRIWVAGCATGEEAFSIAMIVDDEKQKSGLSVESQIFATDISPESLRFAGKAIYPAESVAELDPELRSRYFVSTGDGFQIEKDLRNTVVFAPHNLLTDPPFTQMDVVTCRNLLIYLTPDVQKKVLSLLHFSLRVNGILFLGPSEFPSELSDEFETLSKRWRIYRKHRDNHIPITSRVPFELTTTRQSRRHAQLLRQTHVTTDSDRLGIYEALLERKMPPSILISANYETMHVFNGAERFLKVSSGRQSNVIFDLVDESIRRGLRQAIQTSEHRREAVKYSGLKVSNQNDQLIIDLHIEPLSPDAYGKTSFVIEFHYSRDVSEQAVHEVHTEMNDEATDRIRYLETELKYTRDELHSIHEQMQTSTEELQASNEELVASNEELQSTNEELHSVNEELYTINSEHQRRVEQLAQANNDMDNLLATTRVGVIFLDNDLCIRRFTPEIARQLHLIRQDIGRSFEGFAHHLKCPDLIRILEEVIEQHVEKELEITLNNDTNLLLRALPYRSDNQVDGVVLSLIDITALKSAQSEIERLQFMVEAAVDSIALVRRDGSFAYVNPAMCNLLGYTREELMRMKNTQVDKHRILKDFQNQFKTRLVEGSVFEATWTDSSGNEIPVEISARYMKLDEDEFICKIVRDISDRKTLTDRLEQMGQMIESSNDAIILWKMDGGIESWNNGATRLYGYTEQEALSQSTHELLQTEHPEDWATIEATVLEKGEWYGSCRHTRKDGEVITVSSRHQLLTGEDGEKRILEINRDITKEQKNKEKLERANRAVKQASQAKSEFLANISHELRTPMTAMLGFADILRMESEDPEYLDKVETIKRNGEYLLTLLNDILDLSKIEAGKLEVEEGQVGVREVIEDVRSLMSVRSSEVGIPLLFEFRTDIPQNISGDRTRIRQILVNLISNALKFTDEGHVKVVVGIDRSEQDAAHLNIDVIDTGIGISPADQKRLFKPFSQVTRDMNRQYSGTGLGLSISKRLAEKMHATIGVESQPGEGSRFRLSFPLDESMLADLIHVKSIDELEEDESDEVSESTPELDCRVLLADDRRDVWFVAKYFLETAGADVFVVENGQEAVDAVAASNDGSSFDVILMDMQMPVMDGREAVRELRQRGVKIPIIALTADAMHGQREACLEIGCDDYCPKPINGPDLLNAVNNIVKQHRQKG